MEVRQVVPVAVLALALAAPAVAGPPAVSARAALVENGVTGEVLYASNARARVPIASITKLMTVLVALEHLRPDTVVTIAPEAAAVGESTIGLRAGERLTVRELVEAALIQSANDAADALGDAVSGTEELFVAMMNQKARALGLNDTHFVRPDGLDAPNHYSTARDVTRLARVVMRKPLVRAIVSQTTAQISGGRTLHTWNDLLSTFPGMLGGKTGHTSGAGWSEVAAARSHGVTIYATILGGPSRAQRNADLAELLTWGLDRYRTYPVVRAGEVYARAAAPYGRHALALVAPRTITRIARVDRPLVQKIVAPTVVSLPVRRGETLGTVQVWVGRRLLASSPLVASRSIARPSVGGRVGWYAKRTVRHIWSWL